MWSNRGVSALTRSAGIRRGVDSTAGHPYGIATLTGLDLEISTGRQLSSVIAVLRGGWPGRAVLLRADMAARPVDEAAGVDYSSRIPGAMRAVMTCTPRCWSGR